MEQHVTDQSPQVLTRRTFLRQMLGVTGMAAGAALLAACGAPAAPLTEAPTTGAATAGTSATSAAVAAAAATTVATSAATAASAPTTQSTTTASTGQSANPAIVAAANAFLATLSATEKASALFDWSNIEQRQRWSNFPEGLFTRAGLMWGNISETQQNAWLALMKTTLSTEGYNRVLAEWTADDALTSAEGGGTGAAPSGITPSGALPSGTAGAGGPPSGTPGTGGPGGGGGGMGQLLYGKKYYWVAIIGTPSETSAWQWQWGGHHVTVNATIVGSNIALTPSFIGVQPATYTDSSGATVRPLGDIEDEAFALVNALDATQQKAVILGDTGIDLVLGPGEDGKTVQAEGLPASQMTATQQAALLKFIGHYTGLVNDTAAAARLAEVQATLADTYLAWYGPTTAGSAAYFRVAGPAIVIEFSPQGGGNGGNGVGGTTTANHIHGIYRDPSNDYGAKYTGVTLSS